MKTLHCSSSKVAFLLLLASIAAPAAQDRIAGNLDSSPVVQLKGNVNPGARTEFDRGTVEPDMPIAYATIYLRPADGLESFLADQQTPSSASYHKWLTPEQFADRFGLTGSDISKVTAWLRSNGLKVHDVARGRHWITFSGTAAQVSTAFHTEIHTYIVDGESHFANFTELSIPEALEPVFLGVDGLTDFRLHPMHTTIAPRLNSNGTHYLAPDDLATIYDLTPLYQSGINGAGQKIAIVGTSDIYLTDISTWRAEFNLPANAPQVVLYGPDPGVNAAQAESNLDLEIAGAIARNASLIYVNSANVIIAAQYAVDQNLAPVLSMSYGSCELAISWVETLRPVAQQASAQGITWAISSGDSAAATCDRSSPTPQATKGATVSSPASFPEVTAVGGTEFNEGSGTFWSSANGVTGASALSYIPEKAWNDSALDNALEGGGGGASAYFSKPVWQTGPGVPNDGARDLPDVSFAASADHDGFVIFYQGHYYDFGGTSASTPLFAGIVALLNQSQKSAGMGNINPALYQLAQSTSDVFHDITAGDIIVPCAQGSPDCVNGTLGFASGPGYDRATGLGSIDAAHFISEWNAGTSSTTTLSAAPANIATTDTVQVTATVTGAGAVPTGTVTFVAGDVTLGSATLVPGANSSTASLSAPGMTIAGSNLVVGALYSGDSHYLASSGTASLTLKLPASGSLVIPSLSPNPVYQVGSTWSFLLRLSEMAGVATTVTGFTINGANTISTLPNPNLAAHGSLTVSLTGSGLTVPSNQTFQLQGIDNSGATWQQDLVVPFLGPAGPSRVPGITLMVSPSIMQQNPAAAPSCQWSQQITVQETGGYQTTLSTFTEGSKSLTGSLQQYFGTERLAPLGILTGTICFASAATPSQSTYTLSGISETGGTVTASATASFAAASAAPSALTVSAPTLSIALPAGTQSGTASLDLKFGASSTAPAWTAAVLPAGQKWLTVSSTAGSGSTTLQLQASAASLSNGVYNALLSIQAQDALPQSIQVPVSLVVGASTGISITGIGNAASGAQSFAPGQLVAVYGSNLAASLQTAAIQPLPLTMAGASATVNGVAAPLWFVSPGQINLQIPYETAAGPAVLGIDNGGQVASWPFSVAPAAPGIFAYNGSLVPYATRSRRRRSSRSSPAMAT